MYIYMHFLRAKKCGNKANIHLTLVKYFSYASAALSSDDKSTTLFWDEVLRKLIEDNKSFESLATKVVCRKFSKIMSHADHRDHQPFSALQK